ncbi:hypothetical protein ACPUER_35895, partial [Burkholderia sp. DN3021]|uniref:hypothetical protein n=1 Tax=Burkholderia sp. DN3021 TaxID=3410137 RepID=UPI003C7D863E
AIDIERVLTREKPASRPALARCKPYYTGFDPLNTMPITELSALTVHQENPAKAGLRSTHDAAATPT